MRRHDKTLLSDIAIMRPLLIISIILGHAFTMFAGSVAWPLPQGISHITAYNWLNPTLISFALQAFVFVSGYLFAYKNPQSAPRNKWIYILGRAKRIMLPSIIFSILYIAILHPQKFLKFSVVYEILNGAGHLWFLPMLFWCYLWGTYMYKYISDYTFSKSILLIFASVIAYIMATVIGDPMRLFTSLQYFIYFVLGMWAYKHQISLLQFIKKSKGGVIFSWLAIGILCLLKIWLQNIDTETDIAIKIIVLLSHYANKILLGIVGSITLWATINIIIKDRKVNIRGDIWFGLYIYHQIIMMLLYYHTSLPSFIHAVYLPWLVFVLTFGISYILVVLTLKIKIGKWLLG